MKAIRDIEVQGYSVSREGDKIRVRRKEGFFPDATVVKVLLLEIRERREEVVEYLKRCQTAVWCPYKGVSRWVSWPACEWHREEGDPECQGCDPEKRKSKQEG